MGRSSVSLSQAFFASAASWESLCGWPTIVRPGTCLLQPRRWKRLVVIMFSNFMQNQVLALQENVDSDSIIRDPERVLTRTGVDCRFGQLGTKSSTISVRTAHGCDGQGGRRGELVPDRVCSKAERRMTDQRFGRCHVVCRVGCCSRRPGSQTKQGTLVSRFGHGQKSFFERRSFSNVDCLTANGVRDIPFFFGGDVSFSTLLLIYVLIACVGQKISGKHQVKGMDRVSSTLN